MKNCCVLVHRDGLPIVVIPSSNMLSKKDAQREASAALLDPMVKKAVIVQSLIEVNPPNNH